MSPIVQFLAVALVSALGTAAARAYALRRRLVDEPGARRSHAVATPRGGGAGPVLAILAWLLSTQDGATQQGWIALAFGAVALVGAWDDHSPLPVSWRLLVHLLAGGTVAAGTLDAVTQPMAFVALVVAVVALVNVWNFMDGINGIAASQASIVALALAIVSTTTRGAATAVAVACIAFLPFNFPRARIFLGDVGSGALGLAMAWLLASAAIGGGGTGVIPLLLPLSAFLVDASLTLLRRMLRGERWWEPHTQHLYQGLARRYGHTRVTLAYALWSLALVPLMLVLRNRALPFTIVSVALCYMTAASIWIALQHRLAKERDATGTRDP